MLDARKRRGLLTPAQLEALRSQIARREDAEFLAPQLLEHVLALSREARLAIRRLNATRRAFEKLESAYVAATSRSSNCPECDDPAVREAFRRVRKMADGE